MLKEYQKPGAEQPHANRRKNMPITEVTDDPSLVLHVDTHFDDFQQHLRFIDVSRNGQCFVSPFVDEVEKQNTSAWRPAVHRDGALGGLKLTGNKVGRHRRAPTARAPMQPPGKQVQ